jgi:hypothetical protein
MEWKGMQAFLLYREAKFESHKISNPSPADHKEQICQAARTVLSSKYSQILDVSIDIKPPDTQHGQEKNQ